MKIFIRNRARYNPETADDELDSVTVVDFATTYISNIKELFARQNRARKIDELFLFTGTGIERLEDGRSVAHYNLHHNDILETTSNPFFVTAMYIMFHGAEQRLSNCGNNSVEYQRHRRSKIRKATILQVLFNSKKDDGDTQPRYLRSVDEFIHFVRNHPKKGMEMTPFTEHTLHRFWDEYIHIDTLTSDPLRSFVSRYSQLLGFGPGPLSPTVLAFTDSGDEEDNNRPGPSHHQDPSWLAEAQHVGVLTGGAHLNAASAKRKRGGKQGQEYQRPSQGHALHHGVCAENSHRWGNAGRGKQLGGNNISVISNTLSRKEDGVNVTGMIALRAGASSGVRVDAQRTGIAPRLRVTHLNETPPQPKKTKKKTVHDICESCMGNQLASLYCQDCEGGMKYCQPCSDFTHHAPARKHHILKDLSEAPKIHKQYTPHAYMAPFALILGLFDGHRQAPAQLSMTEDTLRTRAQPLTDTDLKDKNTGKYFGGFDSINSLIDRGLVRREASQMPTYALTTDGITLARRLLVFHTSVTTFLAQYGLPTLPPLHNEHQFCVDTRRVCLVVDEHEKQKERLLVLAHDCGLAAQVRALPAGDYLWILLPPGAPVDYNTQLPDLEQVLPAIVERKTWDDYQDTLRTPRFTRQLESMKRSGVGKRFYLLEGSINDMRSKPDLHEKGLLKEQLANLLVEDGLFIIHTGSWIKTVAWLIQMAHTLLHKAGDGTIVTYKEYEHRVRGRGGTSSVTRHAPRQCHIMQPTEFVDALSKGGCLSDVVQDFSRLIGVPPVRKDTTELHTLVILQGMEAYNKRRSQLLNRCLEKVCGQDNCHPDDAVANCLVENVSQLVHYDVQAYFIMLLHVETGVAVYRTECSDDSQHMARLFTGRNRDWSDADLQGAVVKETEVQHSAVEPQLPAAATVSGEDYAADSQGERDMIEKVLAASMEDAVHQHNHPPNSLDAWRSDNEGGEDVQELGYHEVEELLSQGETGRGTAEEEELKLVPTSEEEQLKLAIQLSLKAVPGSAIVKTEENLSDFVKNEGSKYGNLDDEHSKGMIVSSANCYMTGLKSNTAGNSQDDKDFDMNVQTTITRETEHSNVLITSSPRHSQLGSKSDLLSSVTTKDEEEEEIIPPSPKKRKFTMSAAAFFGLEDNCNNISAVVKDGTLKTDQINVSPVKVCENSDAITIGESAVCLPNPDGGCVAIPGAKPSLKLHLFDGEGVDPQGNLPHPSFSSSTALMGDSSEYLKCSSPSSIFDDGSNSSAAESDGVTPAFIEEQRQLLAEITTKGANESCATPMPKLAIDSTGKDDWRSPITDSYDIELQEYRKFIEEQTHDLDLDSSLALAIQLDEQENIEAGKSLSNTQLKEDEELAKRLALEMDGGSRTLSTQSPARPVPPNTTSKPWAHSTVQTLSAHKSPVASHLPRSRIVSPSLKTMNSLSAKTAGASSPMTSISPAQLQYTKCSSGVLVSPVCATSSQAAPNSQPWGTIPTERCAYKSYQSPDRYTITVPNGNIKSTSGHGDSKITPLVISDEEEDIKKEMKLSIEQVQALGEQFTNVKCGNCKMMGHNRTWKNCSLYNTEAEQARRQEKHEILRQRQEAVRNQKEEEEREQRRRREELMAEVQQVRNHLQNLEGAVGELCQRPGRGRGRGNRQGKGQGRGRAQGQERNRDPAF